LRSTASGKLDALAEELRDQMETKRRSSKDILLLKAREKTYEGLEYNRLKNRVTYRDLQHQVTKKRRIWPIRKVISEYAEELFTLLPCWMCSPESASAIFPMKQMFDLVIFDEASQCFAERGIPAMYRGKQTVVTGDSMQLQPSDLYRVRWEEDDDDTPELAINSLLDLTKHYLPEVSLAGHYRSKSLELIDFSNEHFYKGKLRLLPDYEYVNKKEPAIQYIEAKGVWEDGMNEIEANEVVDIAINHFTNAPEKEIGIVTFNYKQQGLILDILEERAAEKKLVIPTSLFVKNIENVQGDERDIIIFSIGYAPDKQGKVKLQFGSLNADGGENRLNVAVTRAKENVIVVSSISPNQMKTDDTKNDGPKLLKKYLEYAIE
ncbi:P-loop containing nucleoside triphosphate hydrolase protein, partial [Ochromonadaceae sp. CCMP2298]